MKSLLLLLLIGCVVFLSYENHTKGVALRQLAESQEKSEESRRLAELQEQARKAGKERDLTTRDFDTIKRQFDAMKGEFDAVKRELDSAKMNLATTTNERDDARRQVEAANAQIGRLTATTPKPATWFQKKLEGTTLIDSTPKPSTPRPR